MTANATTNMTQGRSRSAPFVFRVRIRNYKSIGKCDVALAALSVLVGRNGAGKSNFLDALRFVADALQTSLDHAIKFRGGIDGVRRRSTGHPRNFAIQLEMNLPDWRVATYGFEIGPKPNGGFVVRREQARIRQANERVVASYSVKEGKIEDSSLSRMPPAFDDRLYLVNAGGVPEFRDLYDALLSMGFYNMNPEVMKELRSPDAGELLHRDGANIASVIARLTHERPELKERIKSYLETVVPGITAFECIQLGPMETLEFRQEVVGARHPWTFYAANMSDGTLRALGALVAVTQLAGGDGNVRLVGIEEPETALHPAAAGTLMDALKEAAAHTQVVVTTHSPELLDETDPNADALLVVASRKGDTAIATVDPASLDAIRSHLYTPGELLRLDQLAPDEAHLANQGQLELFDGTDSAK